MERDPATPAARRDYLFACGLVLLAAVLGAAVPGVDGEPVPGGRVTAILVALAAVGIFALVALHLRAGGRSGADRGLHGSRMRRVALIWLLLAAVLGAAVVRGPALALWSGGPSAPGLRQWLVGAAGATVIVVALIRGLALIRRRD